MPARWVSRSSGALIAAPTDPSHGWLGLSGADGRAVVRFGSCEFRRMEAAHGFANPVGYPAEAVDALQERFGIPAAWQNIFAMDFESLPQDETGLLAHYKLGRDPDAVIVQLGGVYAIRLYARGGQTMVNVRDRVAQVAPPRVAKHWYDLLDRLSWASRPACEYGGTAALAAFLQAARATWPQARLLVEQPLLPERSGMWRRQITEAVRADIAATGAALGVEVVDHDELLAGDVPTRCLNGYNLNGEGSRRIGGAWAELLARGWRS